MKTSSKLWLAGGLAAALASVAGCASNSEDGGNTPAAAVPATTVLTTVPDSAGTAVRGFLSYLMGLDANDEKSEPLLIKDGFAVPADEGNDPQPVI